MCVCVCVCVCVRVCVCVCVCVCMCIPPVEVFEALVAEVLASADVVPAGSVAVSRTPTHDNNKHHQRQRKTTKK